MISCAAEIGLVPREPDLEKDARTILVLRFVDTETGIPVDLSLAYTPFELETIRESDRLSVSQAVLNVARPEDLVILKAVAHRLNDLGDLKQLLDHYPELDFDRIKYWVGQYGEALDEPDLWERIRPLIQGP